MNKKNCIYLPKERENLKIYSKEVEMYNKKYNINLPDPCKDPIVTNNIINVEFDYT
ncbi:MAG: hypothetical protein ACERKV_12460 [Clostridiaceae bacterium]